MLRDSLVTNMFRRMRVTFSLETPFEVVEHNAATQVGNRLTWVYSFDNFEMSTFDNVYVRYRR